MDVRSRFKVATIALTATVAVLCWSASRLPVTVAAQAAQAAPAGEGAQVAPSDKTALPQTRRAGGGAFNAGMARAPEDPEQVARGRTLYSLSCQACHGSDLRGGDMGGPNLLRSQVALSDQHGELITPIIHGARQAQGMPNIGLNDADANAAAAYVRSVVGTIKNQGMPPGEVKPLNIVVGDAAHGQTYFTAHCASCHSAAGDLQHIADKYAEPKILQARWIAGGRPTAPDAVGNKTSVSVTTAPGQTVTGTLMHIDDFIVAIHLPDGTEQSFRRKGDMPKVVVHDPLQAHRDMMAVYNDRDIHDVTAYLVTLK